MNGGIDLFSGRINPFSTTIDPFCPLIGIGSIIYRSARKPAPKSIFHRAGSGIGTMNEDIGTMAADIDLFSGRIDPFPTSIDPFRLFIGIGSVIHRSARKPAPKSIFHRAGSGIGTIRGGIGTLPADIDLFSGRIDPFSTTIDPLCPLIGISSVIHRSASEPAPKSISHRARSGIGTMNEDIGTIAGDIDLFSGRINPFPTTIDPFRLFIGISSIIYRSASEPVPKSISHRAGSGIGTMAGDIGTMRGGISTIAGRYRPVQRKNRPFPDNYRPFPPLNRRNSELFAIIKGLTDLKGGR